MAEQLPNPEEVMAQAGMEAAAAEAAAAPPAEGMAGVDAAAMAGVPAQGAPVGEEDLEALFDQFENEALVAAPQGGGFDPAAMQQAFAQEEQPSPFGDEGAVLMSERVEQLEQRIQDMQQQHASQKSQRESDKIRHAIESSLGREMANVQTGNTKLDKAAAAFVEGNMVYRIAQQAQRNPNAPVDVDAINRFAKTSVKALSRWAKEHVKHEQAAESTRKAASGSSARPTMPSSSEISTDEDYFNFVTKFANRRS
jgi:hypothetical protein